MNATVIDALFLSSGCDPSSVDLDALRRQGFSKLSFQVEDLNQRKEEIADDTQDSRIRSDWRSPMRLMEKRWHYIKTHQVGVTTAIMETKYGTIENYFSEALGIDATAQKALRDLYLLQE